MILLCVFIVIELFVKIAKTNLMKKMSCVKNVVIIQNESFVQRPYITK